MPPRPPARRRASRSRSRRFQTPIAEVAETIRLIPESVTEVSGNTNTLAAAIEEQSITMSQLSKAAEGLVRLSE